MVMGINWVAINLKHNTKQIQKEKGQTQKMKEKKRKVTIKSSVFKIKVQTCFRFFSQQRLQRKQKKTNKTTKAKEQKNRKTAPQDIRSITKKDKHKRQ
jgi:hypothetical protein